ncbi:MAG: VOC family protein [Pseudomonadota bacterium]
MINHVVIGSNNIQRSKAFYDATMSTLGVNAPVELTNDTGQTRLYYIHDGITLGVCEPLNSEPATAANGFTIGFKCNSPEQVDAFHDAAVANGGRTTEDPPGLRTGGMVEMYVCYFLDPDGHKICGVHYPQTN